MAWTAEDEARYQERLTWARTAVPELLRPSVLEDLEREKLEKQATGDANTAADVGGAGFDEAVSRYRMDGDRKRPAIQLDQTQADQARGAQMGSLALLEKAAQGAAPSRAAAYGALGQEQAIGQGTQQMGGARGLGGQIAATRGATQATGGALEQNMARALEGRAKEMGAARGAFSGASGAVRGQDIGAATENAKLVAQGRSQDESRQQGFEKLGWNTRKLQQDTNVELKRQQQASQQALRDFEREEGYQSAADLRAGIGVGAAVGMAALSAFGPTSDERTKRKIVPVGSLAGLMRKAGG